MNPSYHQILFFALYERFIAYPPINVIFTVFAARGFMRIGLELDPWGARSGAAGTLWGHSPPQACRQARSAPPASSAAFPQQRRVRLQSTKKKELSSIKKRPLSGPFALLTLSPAPRSPSRALRACLLCFLPVCPGSSLPPSCSGHTAYYPETSMPAWTSPHKTSC